MSLDTHVPGVFPSLPDARDYRLATLPRVTLPASYTIPNLPPIRDQGNRGSCGAFGSICAVEVAHRQAGEDFNGSEEFQYAETLAAENALCRDYGSDPRTAMEVLRTVGYVTEIDAPYLTHDLCWQPDATLVQRAGQRKIVRYELCTPTIDGVKQAIYAGKVVAFCFQLFQNFIPGADGIIPMPAGGLWGGHWMEAVGWDDSRQAYWVRNQWGAVWGNAGYCWIRYAHCQLPEAQGGLWFNACYTVAVNVAPPPPPPPAEQRAYAQIWTMGPGGWVVTPAEAAVTPGTTYATVKHTAPDGREVIDIPFVKLPV